MYTFDGKFASLPIGNTIGNIYADQHIIILQMSNGWRFEIECKCSFRSNGAEISLKHSNAKTILKKIIGKRIISFIGMQKSGIISIEDGSDLILRDVPEYESLIVLDQGGNIVLIV